MTCHAWPVGGLVVLGGALAQVPPPPPPALSPAPVRAPATPSRSGAEILGRPGIRTRYADPAAAPPIPTSPRLVSPRPPDRPLTVPINQSVEFAPSMEEGPFQQPTIRGLFRWDLQQPAAR
jgi:hypothetical protein